MIKIFNRNAMSSIIPGTIDGTEPVPRQLTVITEVIESKTRRCSRMDWIAQAVEQCTSNAKVVSSNLTSVFSFP